MPQAEYYQRPPSEAESFIIRVMEGCPHNKCTFCDAYKSVPCRVLPMAQVLAGIKQDAEDLGPAFLPMVNSMYLEGGDPLAIDANHLMTIMAYAASVFPKLQRFACYATAHAVIGKSEQELSYLSVVGLRRVFVGLESGSDIILQRTNKGCSSADLALAGEMLAKAGIEMDVSMMLGIGGVELSNEHADKTAQLLNAIAPACVRIRTFTPRPGTELGNEWQAGAFHLPDSHAILRELYRMTEQIRSPMQLLSEHWTNYTHFNASMPEDKERLLGQIEHCLTLPKESLRAVQPVPGAPL